MDRDVHIASDTKSFGALTERNDFPSLTRENQLSILARFAGYVCNMFASNICYVNLIYIVIFLTDN